MVFVCSDKKDATGGIIDIYQYPSFVLSALHERLGDTSPTNFKPILFNRTQNNYTVIEIIIYSSLLGKINANLEII